MGERDRNENMLDAGKYDSVKFDKKKLWGDQSFTNQVSKINNKTIISALKPNAVPCHQTDSETTHFN